MRKTHKKSDLIDVYLVIVEKLHYMNSTEIAALAVEAGVCEATLYNWRGCYVFAPRLNTLYAVSQALGFEIKLVKQRKLKRVA